MIIWAILSAILNSITAIFWKKSLDFNTPKEFFMLGGYSSIFLIVSVLYFTGNLKFHHLSLLNFLILLGIVITGFVINKLYQTIYKRNKMSHLIPYQNISKIIVIIFGFLIFHDTSLITFIIAIIATIIIILFSIDFKNFQVPKDTKLLSILQIIDGIIILTTVYLVKEIGNISYFLYIHIIGIIFISMIVWYKGQFKIVKKLHKNFYIYRLSAAHLGGIAELLSLLVIENLGATLGILVSYIGLAITLLFAYTFLGEKLAKKDIILAVIVSGLIGIGYIYK